MEQSDGKNYQGVSAAHQVMVLAKKEIKAGFSSKMYRIGAVLVALLAFALPLAPKVVGNFSPGGKTVAVVGSPEERQALLAMGALPPMMRHEELDRLPADEGEYDLIVDVSTVPVTVKAEKSSQLAASQGLLSSLQVYQERRQMLRAGVAPSLPVTVVYGEEDSQETIAIVTSVMISMVMLLFISSFAVFVVQGIFADKNSRVTAVLYPQSSALRILAGKILGVGIFGWLQLLLLGTVMLASAELFTDIDWQRLLLPSAIAALAWFIVGYLFVAFIAAALAGTARSARVLPMIQLPLYAFSFASYGVAFSAIAAGDLSAPWLRVVGLFPPFSTTVVPMQAAAGTLDAGYLLSAALVSGACVLACALVGSRVYRRYIISKPTLV